MVEFTLPPSVPAPDSEAPPAEDLAACHEIGLLVGMALTVARTHIADLVEGFAEGRYRVVAHRDGVKITRGNGHVVLDLFGEST